jgi:pyrroline-5-carboxylate reductase
MNIVFIGGGNMAAALISGLVKVAGSSAQIHVVDRNPEALERLAREYGVGTATAIDEGVRCWP